VIFFMLKVQSHVTVDCYEICFGVQQFCHNLSKFVHLPLLLLKKNAQTKQNHHKPTYRRQTNIDWKSNGPCNIPIPENFRKHNCWCNITKFFHLEKKCIYAYMHIYAYIIKKADSK
jgi:hypothetical protein